MTCFLQTPKDLKEEFHTESNLVVAVLQVHRVHRQRPAERHSAVVRRLVETAHLARAVHLRAELRVGRQLREHTDLERGKLIVRCHLAHGGELGPLVQLVVEGHVHLLEEVVASTAADDAVVLVGSSDIGGDGARNGSGSLHAHQQVLVLHITGESENDGIDKTCVVLVARDIVGSVEGNAVGQHLGANGHLLHSELVVVLQGSTHNKENAPLPDSEGRVLDESLEVHITDNGASGVDGDLLHSAVAARSEVAGNLGQHGLAARGLGFRSDVLNDSLRARTRLPLHRCA